MTQIKEIGFRTDRVDLVSQHEKIIGNNSLIQALNGMNIFVILLNDRREIIFMNSELCEALRLSREDVLGLRPGELLKCKYSERSALGCGYADECALCEAKNMVVDVIHNHGQIKKDVSIVSEIQGIEVTSNFEESATRIEIGDEAYYLVAFVDRSSEVDRANLQRIFYHDILNTASSVYNVIHLLKLENEKFRNDEDIEQIQGYIMNIMDEIEFHRSITFAEKNDLQIEFHEVNLNKMLTDTISAMKSDQRFYPIPIEYLESDQAAIIHSEPVLLRRIVMNILKNALEANRNHSTITVYMERKDTGLVLCIRNEEVMSIETQRFIFEKGYSSKGKGRGIGTYGSKLLLEKYLGGQLTFESNEKVGTIFRISLPWEVQNENTYC